ncbi:MAG: SRPBCC family protein [Flavobacteriales bacterium]
MAEPIDPTRSITTTRVVGASRERVFRAWTDPTVLSKWWGPNGFTNTFHTFELRPGGTWDLTMHAPDGANYPNTSVFVEIAPNQRLVFDHIKPMHPFRAEVTFTEEEGGTLITWHMIHPTVEECERMRTFVPQANEENLDKLEAELYGLEISRPNSNEP